MLEGAGIVERRRTILMRRLFIPTARQWCVLLPLGVLALGYALYVRYEVIQNTPIGLACDSGIATALCAMRRAVVVLFQHWVFGTAALTAAVLNLLRPQVVLFAIGMIAAALGIVLYNVTASALAVGLLILSLARPAPAAAPG
jgi:hypothetical protein